MKTISEVAQKAGVSSSTVSHVINNTRFVSPETRKRVEMVIAELGYRPNILARSLRVGETKTIGLILPDSANPFFAESGRQLEEAAFQSGYSLILCNTDGDLVKEKCYTEVLLNKQVDGIIFMATGDDMQSLRELVSRQLPVVIVDRFMDHMELDEVVTDNHQSGYLATNFLITNGHRRIAIIRGPSNITPSAQRVTGYHQALTEANLLADPALEATGDFRAESGYLAAQQLLKQKQPPSAIFACNDLMAIGALRAIHEAGLRVPEDISLIGHDDIEMASYIQPTLTTIAQPITQLAETAIQWLVERIELPSLPPRQTVLANRLVERQSTRRIE